MNLCHFPFLRLFRSIQNVSTRAGAVRLTAVAAMLVLGSSVLSYGQDAESLTVEQRAAVPVPLTLRRHIMLPSSVTPQSTAARVRAAQKVVQTVAPRAVNTGTGIVFTCDSSVPTSTCNYLNTTVAGYYNNVFTNANANIYILFGDTGLGESEGYYNFVQYSSYITALTNNTGKSYIQSQSLAAIGTYASPIYASQNILETTVAMGSALGFTGLHGVNAGLTGPCTPYTSGCYNEVVTVANAAQQAAEGFTLYYDDQGGTETAGQYDFYGVVMHETDEVLGTSSCISTGSSLDDGCDTASGGTGVPSMIDLDRFTSPGVVATDVTPSTTAGQYFSYDGGTYYGAYGAVNAPKVYNTLANGDDFADYTSSTPDCGTNIAVQDAEGCPGEDQGLNILDDGQSEIVTLNAVGYNIPEASMTSPTPKSTLSGANVTFTWAAATGAADYELWVSSVGVGGNDVYNSGVISTTSQAATGLPTSGTVYVRVWSSVGGYWTAVDYTYTGGAAGAATVTLSPTSLAFPSTTVGSTSAAQVVTVRNTGSSSVTLTSETLTGTNPSSFLISANSCGASLAASATCTVSVEFKPGSAAALSASLSVADSATGSPQTAGLSGTGTAAGTGAITLSPTTITFPSTAVGSTSAAQTVMVKNTGSASVTLTSEALTGAHVGSFLISGNTCGASLAASASCTVSVEFKPGAAEALSVTLAVTDNASGSPQTATLSGTGTGGGTITLSPTSIAFPQSGVGVATTAQVVTVKNTSASAVTLNSIVLAGTNPTSFQQIGTCGTSLAAGASCSVYVAFFPASAASLSGKLTVTDTATGSPQTVSLTGTGKALPPVTLSVSTISYANRAHGTVSTAVPVTVTNTGSTSVAIDSIVMIGTNPPDFEEVTTCGATLAPSASCVVYVAFRPALAGFFKAAVSITDNGGASPQLIVVSGTGT